MTDMTKLNGEKYVAVHNLHAVTILLDCCDRVLSNPDATFAGDSDFVTIDRLLALARRELASGISRVEHIGVDL